MAVITLGLAMAIGVSVGVANNRNSKAVYATTSPVSYGPVTFSAALPTDGYWTGTGGGSYCGGYGKNKANDWSVNLDFNTATGIDWSTVDFDETVSLTTSVKAAGNSSSGNVVLSIDNTASQNVSHAITSDFGSGSNSASARAVAMNINSVSSSFTSIDIAFPSKSFITEFSCTLTFTQKGSSGGDPVQTYTVSFDGNGAEGSMSDVTDVSGSYTLPANGFTVPNGQVFAGWKANNEGALIAAGASYNVTADVTFYAQWETRYSVLYDANGGEGTITDSNSPYASGAEVTVKPSTGLTAPTGKDFNYWYTTPSGAGGTRYNPGDTFDISSSITLYAQWVDGINIIQSSTGITGGSYGEGAERTWTQCGVDFGAKAIMKSGNTLQFQASNGRIYNTSSINASIASITLTQSTSVAWTLSCGSASRLVNSTKGNYTVSGGSTTGITAPSTGTTMKWTIAQTQDYSFFCLSKGTTYANVSSILIELRAPNIYASINGSNNVNVGSQWAPTSVTEDESDNEVTGVTFGFAASDGAVISSSSTSTGAFTCNAAGTVTVSATKNGYIIANKVVTVNSLEKFINLDLTTGDTAFTGQTVIINAEYGNGVTGLTWTVPSGTVSSISSSNSRFSATIGGAADSILTIRATDTGSDFYEEVLVDVTKVTLSLNTNSASVAQGTNKTITATHNASAAGGVNWSSNNAKVSVNNGVVSVASDATIGSTATITATSSVDSSVSATCTITVLKAPVIYTVTSKTAVSTGGVAPAGTSASFSQTYGTASQATKDNSFTLTITGFTKTTIIKGITLRMHSNSTGSYGKLYYSADGGENNYLIGDSENGVQFSSWGDNTELTSSYKDVVIGNDLGIVVNNSFTLVIYATSNSLYCNGYTIDYGDGAEDLIENTLTTQTKLSYRYEDNGNGGFDYTDISIRFGGLISKALWNELDTNEHLISGFGVMIASGEALNEDEYIKDNLNARKLADAQPAPSIDEADIVDYYMSKAEMATPVESGDNYFWNLFQRVDYADINKTFVAVAYIKVGDEYVFMNQVRYSVKSLAADYLANRGCNDQTAEGSLSSLAN